MTQLERLECKAAFTADDTGAIEGIAWDFSSPDRVGDVIEATAFAGAIGKTLPALFAHDQSQVVGVFDQISVEADGLHVKGRLLVDTVERAREVRSMIQAKAVSGLSVGFITRKAAPRKGGGRTIQELELLETSIVAVPAHPGARITSQKELPRMTTENTAIDTAAIDSKIAGIETKFAARLDAIEAKAGRLAADNDNEPEGDVETKALNSWLRTGEVDAETKALVVGTPSAGGYTVAPEYSASVITKVTELSPMRRLASVMSIGAGEVYIPTLVSDAEGGWVTETGTRTEDEPVFGQVNIKAAEHAVIIPVSRVLLEDSMIDLSGFLANRIAVKFAQAEATAFVHGDGDGKPFGFLDNPALFEQVDADQDGSDLIDKLIDLYYALPTEYAQRATWAMNRRTMGAIRKAADNTDKGNLWSDSLANGQPARFLGAPVAEFNDMDDLASGGSPVADTFPVAFGDFEAGYQIIDRVGLQVMRDDYTGAGTGIVKFHARRRVGGKLVLPESIALLKGAAA